MAVTITGERELALKFDQFPQQIHQQLEQRIAGFVASLQAKIEGAAPRKTGKLRSEIKGRVYSSQNRVAGYVSVYAPGAPGEYAKAATLEYGSDKTRKRTSRIALKLTTSRTRIASRISKPIHIQAYRYLRGPFDDQMSEFQTELEAMVAEAAAE